MQRTAPRAGSSTIDKGYTHAWSVDIKSKQGEPRNTLTNTFTRTHLIICTVFITKAHTHACTWDSPPQIHTTCSTPFICICLAPHTAQALTAFYSPPLFLSFLITSHTTQACRHLTRALCEHAATKEQVVCLLLFDCCHCDFATGLLRQLAQLSDAHLRNKEWMG